MDTLPGHVSEEQLPGNQDSYRIPYVANWFLELKWASPPDFLQLTWLSPSCTLLLIRKRIHKIKKHLDYSRCVPHSNWNLLPAVWKLRFIGVLLTLGYKCRSVHLISFQKSQFFKENPPIFLGIRILKTVSIPHNH